MESPLTSPGPEVNISQHKSKNKNQSLSAELPDRFEFVKNKTAHNFSSGLKATALDSTIISSPFTHGLLTSHRISDCNNRPYAAIEVERYRKDLDLHDIIGKKIVV